jgi:hypothetical protein
MKYIEINGKEYEVPELDFDAVCELEENGVNLLNLDRKNMKVASMVRGLVAWIMRSDTATASREIEAHIAGGGNIGELFAAINEALTESRFFKGSGERTQKVKKYPQDHQRKNDRRNNTHPSQN